MVDVFTREKRSRIMSSVKGKDTKPEVAVRRLLHRAGYRFRIHERNLPGRPDLYFSKRRKVIFVNGCFWHGHDDCRRAALPNSNKNFWNEKIQANKDRDIRNQWKLVEIGVNCLTVWECQLKDIKAVTQRLVEFLGAPKLG